MKKSLRVLSLILSVIMIAGTMSVAGYAYSDYTGSSISFDDANIATFTTDQYASMALDALDNLLAEQQIVLDIYLGTLNLASVDGTVTSVKSLISKVGDLLDTGLLGEQAPALRTAVNTYLTNTSRAKGDFEVICDVLNLLGGIRSIAAAYVTGDLNLGVVQSFIASYMFDVRQLVIGLVYQLTGMGDVYDDDGELVSEYDYMDNPDGVPTKYTDYDSNGPIVFLQDVLNTLVLGKWQKLDDLFYSETNKTSNVAYSEYEFHVGSASGALVTDEEPDTAAYDYYGYVHPDRWVTTGLGDAIRVANGATAPAASYTKVDITGDTPVYDFVEPLLLHAYNNILVPVLNRITKNWLREKVGYTFDEKYTTVYLTDENGEEYLNPDYDYMYGGVAPAEQSGDRIYEIFNVEGFNVPKATLDEGWTFINSLNKIATAIIPNVIKATYTHTGTTGFETGSVWTYTWTSPEEDSEETYSFQWTCGGNDKLIDNACNLVKFILQVTGDDFFSQKLINKGAVYDATTVAGLTNQQVLAYILRSVLNASVDWMWIDDVTATQTIAGAGFEAVLQLAYQDIPQFTYTAPAAGNTQDTVNKALAVLMDIAAYNLNAVLDTNTSDTRTNGNYGITNNGSTNNTGLLAYLGDNGSYDSTVVEIAKWAVNTWTQTSYGNILANTTLNTAGSNVTEADVWEDVDTIINSIIPIKTVSGASTAYPDNRPWISANISTQDPTSYYLIFTTIVGSVLDLNITQLLELLQINNSGAFVYDTIEVAIIDTLHRIFDLLFPNVFDNTVNTLNDVLVNSTLAKEVSDLLLTLSADITATGLTNGATMSGRGRVIAEFALPIVCMILGLSDSQEFEELENFIPDAISDEETSYDFDIFNASSGINTSYRDANFARQVDNLYTCKIQTISCKDINSGATVQATVDSTNVPASTRVTGTISGYSSGMLLETKITYKVTDETGAYLTSNDLVNISYTYVGSSSKGDDETLVATQIGGMDVLGPTDIYISGSLSSVGNYALRIEDNKNGASKAVTINSVTLTPGTGGTSGWVYENTAVKKNTTTSINDVTMTGEGGTYVFSPFEVDSNAKRKSYIYDEEDFNETTGLYSARTLRDIESPEYYVNEGEYTLTTNMTVNGSTGNIITRVHVYEDYGLPSLLNRAIAANRSEENVSDSTRLPAYRTALYNAAKFILPPSSNGASFDSHIGSANYANKYEELYAALYSQIEAIKPFDASADALTLWNAVNAVLPYNYTRTPGSFDGTSAYYKDYKEYYESGYEYVGQRNYVGFTYRNLKDAVSKANSLIDRKFKYIGYTPEDFEELSDTSKADAITDYTNALESADNANIGAVEAAYVVHLLSLRAGRLISLGAGDVSKLTAWRNSEKITSVTGRASYTADSYEAFVTARTFADATINDAATATPEQINHAMNELIYAWKNLEEGANYTELNAAYTNALTWIAANTDGAGISGGRIIADSESLAGEAQYVEENLQKYTAESYLAYLEALLVAQEMLDDYTNDEGLGVSEQWRIDAAADAITAAFEALDDNIGGGSSEEATFSPKTEDDYLEEGFEGFYTSNVGEYPYYSYLDTEILASMGLDTVWNESSEYYGEHIDGILYGVPEYFSDEDIAYCFNTENCSVTVTENTDSGSFGSGSLAVIKDNDDNVLAIYVIAFRGDLDGDGGADFADVTYLEYCSVDEEGYMYNYEEMPEALYFAAGDINADWYVDAMDVPYLEAYAYDFVEINQPYGGSYE